jgi:hypothetical protein
MNRPIKKLDLNAICIAGARPGGPTPVPNA